MKNEQQIKGQSKFKHKFTREFRQKSNFWYIPHPEQLHPNLWWALLLVQTTPQPTMSTLSTFLRGKFDITRENRELYLFCSWYASAVFHYTLNNNHCHHFICSIIKVIHNSGIIRKCQGSDNIIVFIQWST